MKATRVETEKIVQIMKRFVGHSRVYLSFPDDPDYDDQAEKLMRICKRQRDKWQIKHISHAWTKRKPLIVIFLDKEENRHKAMLLVLNFYGIESSLYFILLASESYANGLRDKDDIEYDKLNYQLAVASALSKKTVILWDDRISEVDRRFVLEYLKNIRLNIILQENVSFQTPNKDEMVNVMKKLEAMEALEVKR